jgi:hypothetical protein
MSKGFNVGKVSNGADVFFRIEIISNTSYFEHRDNSTTTT